MKRLAVLVSLLAVVFASAACAEVKDFGKFTLDVPEGWSALQNDPFAILTREENPMMLQICIDSLNGASLKDVADSWANEFKKKDDWYTEVNVTGPDDDGDYMIRAIAPNGANVQTMFTEADGEYMVISTVGPDEVVSAAGDEISAIINSIKEK